MHYLPSVFQGGHCLGLNSTLEADLNTPQNSITRKAGGRKEVDKDMQVCDIFCVVYDLCLILIREL